MRSINIDGNPILLDAQGYIGKDLHKFWFEAEGQVLTAETEGEIELKGLYGWAISAFFDMRAGIRHDIVYNAEDTRGRGFAVIGNKPLPLRSDFFWMVLWAFILGYIVSSMVQIFVTCQRMQKSMAESGVEGVGVDAFFGFISSSCSSTRKTLDKEEDTETSWVEKIKSRKDWNKVADQYWVGYGLERCYNRFYRGGYRHRVCTQLIL